MCGRYTFTKPKVAFPILDQQLEVEFEPRYNVAPTQGMPVIVAGTNGPEWRKMTWGLIPLWSKEPKAQFTTINARAEELEAKPTWKRLLKSNRCLVPADGFYEWSGPKGSRLPWWFRLKGGEPFCFAGLWDCWQHGDAPAVESFTIITTATGN